MFYIILILAFCAIGSLIMFLDRKNSHLKDSDGDEKATWYTLGIVLNCIGVFCFFLGLIVNLSCYSNQKNRFETIRKEQQNQKILEVRFIDLKAEFTKNLGEKYPDLEKSVFEKMGPEDAGQLKMYFVKYPELKSATTLNYLVDQIKLIADDWYSKQQALQGLYATARYKRISPWLLIRPEIPEDLYLSIYMYKK